MVFTRRSTRRRVSFRRKTFRRRPSRAPRRSRSKLPLRVKVNRIQRKLNDNITEDWYFQQYDRSILVDPLSIYPDIQNLCEPNFWTRTFAVFGTADLEQKDKIRWLSTRMNLRFSLQRATAARTFKVHCFIVKLRPAAKAQFPGGIVAAGFIDGQTHKRNTANAGLAQNNQIMLNPEFFHVIKKWVFQYGSVMDGAPIIPADYSSSNRNFIWKRRMNHMLKAPIDDWKSLVVQDIPLSMQYTMLTWVSSTDNQAIGAWPTVQVQAMHKVQSAN